MAWVFLPNSPRLPLPRIFSTLFANASAFATASACVGSLGSGMYEEKLTSSNIAGGTICAIS